MGMKGLGVQDQLALGTCKYQCTMTFLILPSNPQIHTL